jgi:hypothetical protein
MNTGERLEVRHWVSVNVQGQPDGLPEAFRYCCGSIEVLGKKREEIA